MNGKAMPVCGNRNNINQIIVEYYKFKNTF